MLSELQLDDDHVTAGALTAPAIAPSTRAASRRRRTRRAAAPRQRRRACGRNLASGLSASGAVHVSSMRAMHGAKTSRENVVTVGDARRLAASLQVDPYVGESKSPYGYAGDNPIRVIDPTGEVGCNYEPDEDLCAKIACAYRSLLATSRDCWIDDACWGKWGDWLTHQVFAITFMWIEQDCESKKGMDLGEASRKLCAPTREVCVGPLGLTTPTFDAWDLGLDDRVELPRPEDETRWPLRPEVEEVNMSRSDWKHFQ